jgi:hypothetical protein
LKGKERVFLVQKAARVVGGLEMDRGGKREVGGGGGDKERGGETRCNEPV